MSVAGLARPRRLAGPAKRERQSRRGDLGSDDEGHPAIEQVERGVRAGPGEGPWAKPGHRDRYMPLAGRRFASGQRVLNGALARSARAGCQVVYLPVDRDGQLARDLASSGVNTLHQTFPMTEAEIDQMARYSSRCLTQPSCDGGESPRPGRRGGRAGRSGLRIAGPRWQTDKPRAGRPAARSGPMPGHQVLSDRGQRRQPRPPGDRQPGSQAGMQASTTGMSVAASPAGMRLRCEPL